MIAVSSRIFCIRSSGCQRRSYLVVRRTRSNFLAVPTLWLCSTHRVSDVRQCLLSAQSNCHAVLILCSSGCQRRSYLVVRRTRSNFLAVPTLWLCSTHRVSDFRQCLLSTQSNCHAVPTLCSAHSVGKECRRC